MSFAIYFAKYDAHTNGCDEVEGGGGRGQFPCYILGSKKVHAYIHKLHDVQEVSKHTL